MNELTKKIGYEIRNIRIRLGLTQAQYAKLFNETEPKNLRVTQADVSRYELAQVRISAEKLEKFRSLLNEAE